MKSTNINLFLQACHPKEHADYQNRKRPLEQQKEETQLPLKKFCPVVSVTSGNKLKVDNLIINYIVNSMLPLSTTEDPNFRAMIRGNGAEWLHFL